MTFLKKAMLATAAAATALTMSAPADAQSRYRYRHHNNDTGRNVAPVDAVSGSSLPPT